MLAQAWAGAGSVSILEGVTCRSEAGQAGSGGEVHCQHQGGPGVGEGEKPFSGESAFGRCSWVAQWTRREEGGSWRNRRRQWLSLQASSVSGAVCVCV